MTFPGFSTFVDTPFGDSTRVIPTDPFTGTGATNTFALQYKSGLFVGPAGDVAGVQYPLYNQSMVVSGNNIVFPNYVPPSGAQILIPGSTGLIFTASDQNDSLGRAYECYFYIGDVDTIASYTYGAQPGDSGIALYFNATVSADLSQPSWFQLAPANADGTPGTYLSAGATLYTPPISAQDTLQSNQAALSTTVPVANGSQFLAGDYIMLNFNGSNAEVVKITSITSNTLNVPGLTYAHTAGESVLTCGRKFWAQMTVPLNATSGTAQTYFGTPLRRRCRVAIRF